MRDSGQKCRLVQACFVNDEVKNGKAEYPGYTKHHINNNCMSLFLMLCRAVKAVCRSILTGSFSNPLEWVGHYFYSRGCKIRLWGVLR